MVLRFTLASDAITIHDPEASFPAREDYAEGRAEEVASEVSEQLSSSLQAPLQLGAVTTRQGEFEDQIPYYEGHFDLESEIETEEVLRAAQALAEQHDSLYAVSQL